MKAIFVLAFLLAPMLQLPAAARQLSFGQLCGLIITNPKEIPKNQVFVVPKSPQPNQPLFSGDVTTCVIYQMAAYRMHEPNWDYSKQAVQWYNQQERSQRAAIAADLAQGSSRYPDLKALMDLNYVKIKKSIFTGPHIALGEGPFKK